MTGAPVWEIVVELPSGELTQVIEGAIEDFVTGLAIFEIENSTRWRVTGYMDSTPEITSIKASIAAAAAAAGAAKPTVEISRLVERDWVAESERSLSPIHVAPYFVFGSHIRETPPPGSIAIQIDASLAFGTGNHETTQGCLQAFEAVFADHRPGNPLDVGTGSGILAIAVAKRFEVDVTASDNDPVAIDVARENAVINGVDDRITFAVSEGLEGAVIGKSAPYDLIVANIVANPLIALASDIANALSEDGVVILSGILTEQAGAVIAAYAEEAMSMTDRIVLGNWATLILRRGLCVAGQT